MNEAAEEPTQTPASEPEKNSSAPGRDKGGRFLRGVSGNPKGKPPLTPTMREVKELCVLERPANVARLVWLRDNSKDQEIVLEAIKIMLSYSDGKPVTAHLGAPLVNVNLLGTPAGGRQMTPAEAYAYLCARPELPPEEVRGLIEHMKRPAIEAEVQASAESDADEPE